MSLDYKRILHTVWPDIPVKLIRVCGADAKTNRAFATLSREKFTIKVNGQSLNCVKQVQVMIQVPPKSEAEVLCRYADAPELTLDDAPLALPEATSDGDASDDAIPF